MKYISTFSGIEAASVAWEPLGWKPMAFCEIDDFPSAVLARHYPDVPNLGDITKVDWKEFVSENGRPDVVVGGSPCFTAGTLVLCESGFKPIEEVEVGEKVVTHKGNLKRVLNVGSKISDTIILKGQGSVGIECTPNHPFYSREKHKIWDNAKREYLMVYDKSSEWRNAESMEGKFWLNVCDVKKTPIPQFPEHGKGKRGKGYVNDFTFNEDFFYFVGRWLGDGWANAHKRKGREESLMKRVYVCCSHDESNDLEDRLLSTGLHFGKSDSGSTVRFTCSSTQLYDWLVGNFGVHADGKNMPAWCFGMSEKFRASMLSGYLDADGTKVNNGYKSTTINRSLSLGIKMLAGSLGMASSVTLNVNHRDATIEGRKVNERPNYVSSHYANSRSAFFADSGYYGLVRNVADARKNVTVYNLEVEDDNSYTADGIAVHNCQSFSVAGGRESLGGESRLMFEYIRALAEIRPKWFLWENVPGVLNTRDNAFAQLLREVQDIGYGSVAWRVLDAQFFGVAQRRRRVFLVGHLGTGGGAAAVLFESESMRGDNPSSKQKKEELARAAGRGASARDCAGFCGYASHTASSIGYQEEQAPTLKGNDWQCQVPNVLQSLAQSQYGDEIAGTLTRRADSSPCSDRGQNIVCMAHTHTNAEIGMNLSPTLTTHASKDAPVLFASNGDEVVGEGTADEMAVTIHDGSRWVVRRLMPVECERLQGFPTIVSLDTEKMTRDELFVCALINGDVSCDVENGIVYTNRGPGGTRLKEPKKLGCKHPSGYIVFSLHFNGVRKQIRAHRAVWIAANGLIPDGYVVDHINNDKSDNRICNLQLLTPKENSHKAKEDGLYLTDTDNPCTKIPAYMHSVIQHDYMTGGGSYKQLAVKYGISKARIRDIIKESGYTDIPYKGKEHPPNTLRYKALGNSMAVPVMRWIGERIQMVDSIINELSEEK